MQKEKSEKVVISYPDGRQPLPKQLAFHMDETSRIKALEGGFASGKSYAGVYDLLINLLKYPGNECVYGRLTIDEITRTFFPIWDEMCPSELIISHNQQKRKIVLRTSGEPSTLYYMPLDDNKGVKHKIKSMNLGYVFVDQMEEVSEEVLLAFLGRLRRRNSRRQFAFNANPEGHNWIWKRFYKEKGKHPKDKIYEMNAWTEGAPVPTEEEMDERAAELKKDPQDLTILDFPHYVQYSDNPYLPMAYLISMLSMPDEWKKRYLFGKHDAFEGLIYTEFNENVHLIPQFDTSSRKFVRLISMDYGKHNPTSIHFWDIDDSGNIYCSNEIYQKGLDIPTMKIMLRAMNRDKEVSVFVADPSIWKVVTPGYPSVGDLFNTSDDASGWAVNWTRADNSMGAVSSGIDIVKQYLKHDAYTDAQTKVFFMKDRCPKLIEEIQDYRWKEMSQAVMLSKQKNFPEVPRKYKDHAMDDMRYALTHIRRFNIKPKETDNRLKKFLRQYHSGAFGRRDTRGYMVA